jgi:ParB family chromosome partitioning protein
VEELGLTREDVGRRVGRSRVAISNLVRLLDLPDEAIALVQDGALSEGHGRALLLAHGHGERRSLARAAAEQGWSVRVTEARARESNSETQPSGVTSPDRARRDVHPDQEHAAREIAQTLGAALGSEVRVKATSDGRYSAQLSFATAAEARELAQRIRPLESATAGD